LGKLLGNRSLEEQVREWSINIKMDLREIDYEHGRWVEFSHFRVMRAEPSGPATRELI
jgi:hypothetical protein